MANEILNSLLREYEQKKLNAELDLENRLILLGGTKDGWLSRV